MPIYEYNCLACGVNFTLFQKIGAPQSESVCPTCKSNDVKRLISSFSCGSESGGFSMPSAPSSGGM
ncbi:MAG: zinc ribbon domain-containing protein [Candidatus Magnetobacterium sp. LHC-1]|uniref:Zinc ribbon domain-containing protein n=1 Tax=Candidatus Magnetobacterium casense TaxID=1455061 RepID=A0ABS6RZN7_9BACT|nr:zinc ribbon domain-containing protein [Candidatus Magnetobacterium casensis]MBF0609222.1 zinc ribbon domain-containing protein [Nitrospirota bacterium]MBV6341603.1 zinc ribbon domain-containing protein [Candidatus Magnetobacterium casensis]